MLSKYLNACSPESALHTYVEYTQMQMPIQENQGNTKVIGIESDYRAQKIHFMSTCDWQ